MKEGVVSTHVLAKCPVYAPVGIAEVLLLLKCSIYATVAIENGGQPKDVLTGKSW